MIDDRYLGRLGLRLDGALAGEKHTEVGVDLLTRARPERRRSTGKRGRQPDGWLVPAALSFLSLPVTFIIPHTGNHERAGVGGESDAATETDRRQQGREEGKEERREGGGRG